MLEGYPTAINFFFFFDQDQETNYLLILRDHVIFSVAYVELHFTQLYTHTLNKNISYPITQLIYGIIDKILNHLASRFPALSLKCDAVVLTKQGFTLQKMT